LFAVLMYIVRTAHLPPQPRPCPAEISMHTPTAGARPRHGH
jgi:hypothetical protein